MSKLLSFSTNTKQINMVIILCADTRTENLHFKYTDLWKKLDLSKLIKLHNFQ